MSSEEKRINYFTFIWKVENVSFCHERENQALKSPAFVVDAIYRTKWKLWLFLRDKDSGIGVFIHREKDSKGPRKVEVNYDLAFISKDGKDVVTIPQLLVFDLKNKGALGCRNFLSKKRLYVLKRSEFLPDDTLTIRCRIWKSVGEIEKDIQYIGRTRIGIEKQSILWNVRNFDTLEFEEKRAFEITSKENGAPLMHVNLFLTGGLSSKEIYKFQLSLRDKTIKFCTLSLFIQTASEGIIPCHVEEIWFDNPDTTSIQFTFSLTKKQLLEQKSFYLTNNTLSLLWECTFSKGVVFEDIKETLDSEKACHKDTINNHNEVSDEISLSNGLINNIKSMYDEHLLSDVKLKNKTSVFPAHKLTLSAASPVFKATFSNNKEEKNCQFVYMEDLNDDTISRMLQFIYTGCLENLTWERASHLYAAADTYAILNLKNMCSSFLKKNLSPSKACELLLLADLHKDSVLKSDVRDYILINNEIIKSDEWKILMRTDENLATETMSLLLE